MSEIIMIPDTADKEIDWPPIPEVVEETVAAVEASSPLREVNRKFGWNVAATIASRVLIMARGVLLVPFLLLHIGLEAYGIWTTVFILVTYVGVTTLGLSNVYMKYAAEFHARREYHKANALLSTGLAITVPLCGAIFAGFYFGWSWYSPWLHLPASHAADGREAVLIVLGVFLSSIAFNGFGDILAGVQQIAATQVFLMISVASEFLLIIWFVSMGRGIRGLAEAYLVRTIINDGLTIWWAWRKLDWLHLSPRLVGRESIKYVVHFGGVVQFQTMLSIFLASVERVAGLGLINATAAGILDVGKKWPNSLSTVPMAFFNALLPAAAHVDAASSPKERVANLRALYLSSSRYSNLCTAAFTGAIVFWASPMLHVWLGAAMPAGQHMVAMFVVFSLAMQMHLLTGPGTSMFRGMGRVYEEFTYSIPNVLLLGVTLPMAHWIQGRWTPFGIAVAVSLATVASACILLGRVLFVLKLSLFSYLGEVIIPGLAPYLVAALMALPVAWLVASVDRWQGVAVILASGVFYVAGSIVVLSFGVLTNEEKEKGWGVFQRGLEVLRRREATA